jgi:hypothetical protein
MATLNDATGELPLRRLHDPMASREHAVLLTLRHH